MTSAASSPRIHRSATSKLAHALAELKWRDAAIIFAVTLLVANWQLLIGRAYEKWDAFDLGTPYFTLLADFTRAGRLLFWNPWISGGSPDFAAPGSGTFSPLILFFALITGGGGIGFDIYWLAVWLGGGLGMLMLGRHLGAPAWAALAVALGFVFSGFYSGHAEHTSVLCSYSFIPWIIWRLDKALLEARLFPAVQAGALWGLSGLEGYASLTLCTVGLILAWGIGRWIGREEQNAAVTWWRALRGVAITGIVGVAVLSPSYVSFAHEGAGYSDRGEPLSRAEAIGSNALSPTAVATVASPSLIALNPSKTSLWSYTDVSSRNLYTGGVTIVLASLALVGGRRNTWRWYILALALLALGFALARALPLRGWAYDFIYPTRFFRHAGMLRGYCLFLLSVLALRGARDFRRGSIGRACDWSFIVATACCAIAAAVSFAAIVWIARELPPQAPLAIAHFILLWGGLTTLAICLQRIAAKTRPFLPLILITIAIADGLIACSYSEGTLYNYGPRPDFPQPRNKSVALGAESFARTIGSRTSISNEVSKIPTLKNYSVFKNRFHEAIAGNPRLARIAVGRDRVWFAREAVDLPLTDQAFRLFAARSEESAQPIIVKNSPQDQQKSQPPRDEIADLVRKAEPAVSVPARNIRYSPNQLTFDATAPDDGWLMVTDRWSRSWVATVNGAPQPIAVGDFIFRAVPVKVGANHIDFSYRPFGMPSLVVLSWTVLALVAGFSFAPFARDRREPGA
ncbi:MAG: hypothetical protein ACJ8HU_10015 [Chthoniobacterales bacterium]